MSSLFDDIGEPRYFDKENGMELHLNPDITHPNGVFDYDAMLKEQDRVDQKRMKLRGEKPRGEKQQEQRIVNDCGEVEMVFSIK